MAEVVLFHHVRGLTPGVRALAEEWRQAGHSVHTPDLFGGETFETIEEGIAHVRQIGFEEVLRRGVDAASELPQAVVYAGLSLGVLPAQKLAQTTPSARGAVFYYSCVPYSEFGDAWPASLPVQIHAMDADPSFTEEGDIEAARELVEAAPLGELFLYSGSEHLFAEKGSPSYDEEAASLASERVLGLLSSLA